MKNLKQIKAKFKKKAFTLVELLVAIAIVAVISTVSVVGYTSFIKKADISNDETLVRQLNSFLDAYRVSNGNLEVTPENAREVILSVMEKGKVAELVPNSAKYGYHFYLDFSEGKAKFALKHNDDAFGADSQNAVPEMCFTKNSLFFADTQGNDLADFVNKFYTVSSQAELNSFKNEAVSNIELDDGIRSGVFTEFIDKGLFVSKNGNFATDGAKNRVFFNDGITSINSSEHLDSLTVSEPIQIPISVKFITSGALVFADQYKYVGTDSETVFKLNASNAEKLGGMVDPKFTNAVFELTDGNRYAWDEAKNKIVCLSDPSVEISVDYKNKLQSFTLYASSETQGKVAGTVNEGVIAWDAPEFELKLGNLVGTDPSYEFISAYNIEWEFDEKYVTLVDGRGVFKFTNELPESSEITIKATDTINNATQTYTVKVYRITGATIKLAGKPWNDRATLIYGDQSNSDNKYTISATDFTYSFDASELELDETVSLVTSGDAFGVEGATLKANSAGGTQSVSVKIGTKYVSSASEISIYNVSNLPFSIKYGNLAMVGNGNNVTAGDLFRENTTFPATLPADAKLVVYSAVYGDDNYINLDNRVLMPNAGDGYAFYVNESEIALNSTDWKNTPIKFNGTSTAGAPVAVAIQFGDVRVSPDVSLAVVDGKNVRNYNELKANVSSSVVLLNDIKMDAGGYIIIPAGSTFYGNCFTFDVTKGITKYVKETSPVSAIITLSGSIKDTKIVGEIYTSFGMRVASDYGSSLIASRPGAYIENCYLSGCRSPLRLEGDTIVKDTVLFGGRYSNIDITDGVLTIQGNVTTINQKYNHKGSDVLGTGITFWWSANPETSKVLVDTANGGNLIQYNFVSSSDTDAMPNIGIVEIAKEGGVDLSGIPGIEKLTDDMGIDLGDIFNKIITESTYERSVFGGKAVNSGIVYLNKNTADVKNLNSETLGIYDYVYDPDKDITGFLKKLAVKGILKKLVGSEKFPAVVNTYLNKVDENNQMYTDSPNATEIYKPWVVVNNSEYNISAGYGFGADGKISTVGN